MKRLPGVEVPESAPGSGIDRLQGPGIVAKEHESTSSS